MSHLRLLAIGTLILCGIHCTEPGPTTGIIIPAYSGGLSPYEAEGWGGTEPTNYDEDASLAVERGPLCIGLTPPEDAYLPLEVESDVTEDTEEERDIDEDAQGDTATDVAESEAGDGAELLTDVILADSEEDTEEDASGGTMRTFAVDTTDAQGDDVNEDTSSGRIPLPPAPEVEEEEPYDCTPLPQTCVGADAPESFALFDFQPQSCGFQATYGLSLYKNHVTMVALLAAW